MYCYALTHEWMSDFVPVRPVQPSIIRPKPLFNERKSDPFETRLIFLPLSLTHMMSER